MRLLVPLAALAILTACRAAPPPVNVDGTVVAAVQATLTAQPSPTATTAPPTAMTAAPTGLLRAGEEGIITLSVADIYPLTENAALHRQLDEAAHNGNDAPVLKAVAEGRAIVVTNHTKVRVLAYDDRLVKVEVLDGDQAGKSGWLPINLVGRSP